MVKDSTARFLAWAAITLAVLACAVAIWRWEGLEADAVPVVISVLALVVTVYMIIHVWNEFTLKQRVTESVSSEFDKKIDSAVYHHMYLAFFFQGVNNEERSQIEAAVYFYVKSLECLTNTEIDQDKYDEILMRLENMLRRFPDTKIGEADKKLYLDSTISLPHDYRKRLLRVFKA